MARFLKIMDSAQNCADEDTLKVICTVYSNYVALEMCFALSVILGAGRESR
jgi:hypothetical protein